MLTPQRAAARDFQHFFLDGWQDHKPAGTGPYPIAPLVACSKASRCVDTATIALGGGDRVRGLCPFAENGVGESLGLRQ